MKQANNNEVDLLLRSLARGRDESTLQNRSGSGDGNRATPYHLDADELNSYAEGVVPAPARARYTEHLADCDVCRRLVIGLTSASGAAMRSDASQKGGLAFWQKLAAILSPAVLRYAVPALVLTAVIGIGVLVMWQQRSASEFVATNRPADPSSLSGQATQTESPASESIREAPSTMQEKTASPAAFDSLTGQRKLQDDRARENEAAGSGTGADASGTLAAKDARQPEESTTRVESRPTYAPEPKAAAPPAATPAEVAVTTQSEADKTSQLARAQPGKREDQERHRDFYKNAPTDEHGPNRSAAPRVGGALTTNRRLDDAPAGRGGPYKEGKKDKAGEVETRTVSGRRFAREGNAWVDTAYDSSRTPVRVGRGTEQFRALIADEPGLRAIAEQLNGVVIVVWKNRAYRIQ